TVTESRGGGRFGRKGSLELTFDYTTAADGQSVPLRAPEDGAEWEARGKGGLGKVTSFFGGGRDIVVEPGTQVTALVDRDLTVSAKPVELKTLVLKNGDRITGAVQSTEGGVYVMATPQGTLKINAADVERVISAGGGAAPAGAPKFKLLE
ncbi:MAG TPA: hypothetical protein VFU47_00090, partial [Armatimonadota bacterium]|nr:hypothetical protein [Armatimonadota bacterium]